MAKKEPGVKLPPVDQIGIVVKDIDRAIEYYSSTFGWGPFRVREREMKGFTYRDKIGDCRLKLAFARAGEKAPLPPVIARRSPRLLRLTTSASQRQEGEGHCEHLKDAWQSHWC